MHERYSSDGRLKEKIEGKSWKSTWKELLMRRMSGIGT